MVGARRTAAAQPQIQRMCRDRERASDRCGNWIGNALDVQRSHCENEQQSCRKEQTRSDVPVMSEIRPNVTHDSNERRRRDEEPLDAFVRESAQPDERQQTREQRERKTMNGTSSRDDDSNAIPARGAHGQTSSDITHGLTVSTAWKAAPRLLDGWCSPSHEWFVVQDELS